MVKMLMIALLAACTYAGAAMADCGAPHTAMSTSTVTAQDNASTPTPPASETRQNGG